MAGPRPKPFQLGTASLIAVVIFLLAWSVFERRTGSALKHAAQGTTNQAANHTGASVTPSDQPSGINQ